MKCRQIMTVLKQKLRVFRVQAQLWLLLIAVSLCACQSNTALQDKPRLDLQAAYTYMLPALHQHSAFGVDTFVLSGADPASRQQFSALLQQHGAAVCPEGPGSVCTGKSLQLQQWQTAAQDLLIVSLKLPEVSLWCAFRQDASGAVVPASAVSVQRG